MNKIRRIAALTVLVVNGFVLSTAPAFAGADEPRVWLRCEAHHDGCAGASGRFTTSDGALVGTVAVIVRDAAGTALPVGDQSCTVRSNADRPQTVAIECMVDAPALGLAETITWTVELNGTPVWTSPPVSTRCSEAPPDQHPVGGVNAPENPLPVEPTPAAEEVPIASPTEVAPPADNGEGIVPPIGGITAPEPNPETAPPSVVPTPPVGSVAAPTRTGQVAKPLIQEELPLTGADLEWFGLGGILVIASGASMVHKSRPRRRAQ